MEKGLARRLLLAGRGLALTLVLAAAPLAAQLLINEVDADTPSIDALELVELYDGGAGNTSLSGLVLVFFNGALDSSYLALDLDSLSTDATGYFVAGNSGVAGVDILFANDTLQNGADAVALYIGDAVAFPNGTPLTTANLVDALVYDTSDSDDLGLLVLLNPGQPQVNENAHALSDVESNQRCPNGSGGARNTTTYSQLAPSPGGANACGAPPVVAAIHDVQGSGALSPLAGVNVTVSGIVTAVRSNAFFLQATDADADADPATSEAIFVFTGGAPPVAAAVGNEVDVTGIVSEFSPGADPQQPPVTEITAPSVALVSSGNPLPAPIVLDDEPTVGGVFDQLDRTGQVVTTTKRLWPQTERVKAAALAARITKDECYWGMAAAAANGLLRYLSTDVRGLWYDRLTSEGTFIREPAPASSFYHIVAAVAELSTSLDATEPK